MKALIRLYFISWLRGFVGPFFSFVFPIVMIILLGQFVPFRLVAPTYIAYCAITLGIQSLSISLVQFKSSSLIKRIGQTPITRKDFIFSILLFNIILVITACATTVLAMVLLQKFNLVKIDYFIKVPELVGSTLKFKDKAIDFSIHWEKVQWAVVWLLGGIAALFSISVGLLISTFAKTTEKANGLGLFAYFILSFLSGIFFPLSQIKGAKALDWSSIFVPLRPIAESLSYAFNGTFNFYDAYKVTVVAEAGTPVKALTLGPVWAWLMYPVGLALFFILISIIFFKWE